MNTNEIAAPVIQTARPEWIRMPKPGSNCVWTGLGRSYLYQLATSGKIRTISLRQKGKVRGVRLINLDSVLSYLSQVATVELPVRAVGGASGN